MAENSVLLDAFTRVRDSMHRILDELTVEELSREPHPSIGWLAWRLTRVQDNNLSRLGGNDQLWLAGGWHARFGMPAEPFDFGRGAAHTREQVRVFEASSELLLAYHDATYGRTVAYLQALPPGGLDRELDEPQYTPLPTVGVRLVSVLENGMQNAGQMGYLKAYHRLGGWFPAEGSTPGAYR
ncbi:MAG: hypothetical protein QOF51_4005 [Chloroflexota bacterium]|nr:hypothetical protein [Chloroflexota bacterium]